MRESKNLKPVTKFVLKDLYGEVAELRISTVGDTSELFYQLRNSVNLNLRGWNTIVRPNLPTFLDGFDSKTTFNKHMKDLLLRAQYKAAK